MYDVPHLYDAVTLRHFAAAEVLETLRAIHERLEQPRWAEAVADEIAWEARAGSDHCIAIQEFVWLGAPLTPDDDALTLVAIARLQIALGDGRRNHGEAESIHLVQRLGGVLVTDDAVAHDFARRRLGHAHVADTCDVLLDGIRHDIINPSEASDIACRITDADRHLRRGRPRHPGSTYFEQQLGR